MADLICSQCGSEYDLEDYKLIERCPDSIECQVCGKTIKEWFGSRQYSAKLVKRGEWPKK